MGIFSRFFSGKDNISDNDQIDVWISELVSALEEEGYVENETYSLNEEEDEINILYNNVHNNVRHIKIEFIIEKEGNGYINFELPLVYLPKNNKLAFYRNLLRRNSFQYYDSQFGHLSIVSDLAYLSRVVQVEELDFDRLLIYINNLSAEAIEIEDELVKEFNAPVYSY